VDALLKATAQVLGARGYDGASTNRIAARAGVNIASLYQYFPSKEALVAALIDRHLERLLSWLVPAFEAGKPLSLRAAVEAIVQRYLANFLPDVSLHRVLLSQVPRVERLNPVIELRRMVIERLEEELRGRRAVRDSDASIAAFAMVHLIDALAQAAVLERPELLTDPAYARLISDLAMHLIRRHK
jgi:AcrR family transcriptional regulator